MLVKENVVGVVKFFVPSRGFGFINTEDMPEKDIFVHYSFIEMEGYRTVNKDDKVVFDLYDENAGLQAKRVRVIRD